MIFNNLILCIILWVSVQLISIFVAFIERRRQLFLATCKKQYMNSLLNTAQNTLEVECLLRESYYSFSNNRFMRKILLRALKVEERSKTGFNYVYKRLGCEPMALLHKYISEKSNEKKAFMPEKAFEYFVRSIEDWEYVKSRNLGIVKRKRFKLWIEKNLMFIGNLMLYYKLQNEWSWGIVILVNTIGVILFIILDYECAFVDSFTDESNVKKRIRLEKKTQSQAMLNIYQLVAGLGLIVNISIAVSGWLGQIA